MTLAVVLCAAHGVCAQTTDSEHIAGARRTLALFEQELTVIEQLLDASARFQAANYVFRHVNVVDVAAGVIRPDMRVRVAGGRIVDVAPDRGTPVPRGFREIDGHGKYLMHGLVDMHVHQLTSASQHLLHVASGVTTVRDMVGFPWLLEWRDLSRRDAWLAPSMYVAGPILSTVRMGMYAHVISNGQDAREAVREHDRLGYDFIKVHNVLPKPLFRAVTDEARRLGIPVVGHVPHRVTVAEAVGAGLLTLEHLKGYIDDRTLQIAADDWISPTRDSHVWNTPTLYTHRLFLTPPAAREWASTDEARFVPRLVRERWLGEVGAPPTIAVELLGKQREVMRRLLPVSTRFLAGTDAGGGYPFMVSGFALYEELRLLHDAGLPLLETIRAATWYPARALGAESEFGRVAVGLRADLLLLDSNPLVSLAALRSAAGVMLRGRWLTRAAIDHELKLLAITYAEIPDIAFAASLPDVAWIAEVDRRTLLARERGYVFPQHHLEDIERAFRALGLRTSLHR
ncbi:MAG: amidohydrolase family protein [Bacteroidota bacterium]